MTTIKSFKNIQIINTSTFSNYLTQNLQNAKNTEVLGFQKLYNEFSLKNYKSIYNFYNYIFESVKNQIKYLQLSDEQKRKLQYEYTVTNVVNNFISGIDLNIIMKNVTAPVTPELTTNVNNVVIMPDLVQFTPVSHKLYERKTFYTPFNHPFHIVDPSPWPFCTSIALWFTALNTIAMVHNYIAFNLASFLMGLLYLLFSLAGWWRDVIRESTYEFKHTAYVRRGLLLGMMLFIISEVMFFFGFFWAFFHSSLVPSPAIGGVWPPVTIMVISPWKLPLVNSLLLLLSGVTLTISHRFLVYLPYYNKSEDEIHKIISIIMLWLRRTIYLGIFFLFCQAFEYYFAAFTFQDTVYGGTFYILTGLHGLHVLVGTIFLMVCLWRTSLFHFTVWKQVGFKSAVWYWHFVDVVWIFLYLVIYVWGNA